MMKRMPIAKMATLIRDRLAKGVVRSPNGKKRIASILEQDSQTQSPTSSPGLGTALKLCLLSRNRGGGS